MCIRPRGKGGEGEGKRRIITREGNAGKSVVAIVAAAPILGAWKVPTRRPAGLCVSIREDEIDVVSAFRDRGAAGKIVRRLDDRRDRNAT